MNPPGDVTPIYIDQHGLLVGTTGSGKSTEMAKMLAWRLRKVRNVNVEAYKVILIDTKPVSFGQDDARGHYGFTGGIIYRDWKDINLATEKSRLIIYRPTDNLINPEDFGKFFDILISYRFRQKNGQVSPLPMTVIIDELIDVFSSEKHRTAYMRGFTKMLVQGRSSLQTLWILTQFPVYIDPAIKRNVAVNFIFRLPDENDRKIMAGITGSKLVSILPKDPHGFWYQNTSIQRTLDEPLYFTGSNQRSRRLVAI